MQKFVMHIFYLARVEPMKIQTEIFPVRQIKNDVKPSEKQGKSAKASEKGDRVTISSSSKHLVLTENKAASETALLDFKQAEAELDALKDKLLDDTSTASEIHQLGNKRVLFFALD